MQSFYLHFHFHSALPLECLLERRWVNVPEHGSQLDDCIHIVVLFRQGDHPKHHYRHAFVCGLKKTCQITWVRTRAPKSAGPSLAARSPVEYWRGSLTTVAGLISSSLSPFTGQKNGRFRLQAGRDGLILYMCERLPLRLREVEKLGKLRSVCNVWLRSTTETIRSVGEEMKLFNNYLYLTTL